MSKNKEMKEKPFFRIYPPLPDEVLNQLIDTAQVDPSANNDRIKEARIARGVVDYLLDVPGSKVSVPGPEGKSAIFMPTTVQKMHISTALGITEALSNTNKEAGAGAPMPSAKRMLRNYAR